MTTLDTATRTGQISDANRLGLDYRDQAARLPYGGPIMDVHTHLNSVEAARLFFEVADVFGVEKVWSMSPLEQVDGLSDAFGERIEFIAVPNYMAYEEPDTFTTDWLKRIEGFREKGSRTVKFWAAPRGRDLHPDALLLDSPIRKEGMKLSYDLGYRVFMVHVADPDTWFATKYSDAAKYGTKRSHYPPLEEAIERYPDVTWIGAHMAGSPENLDFLQGLLDRHPNLVIDTAATKWMTRELSKKPEALAAFCKRNAGRVLFGSDIVATSANAMGVGDDGKPVEGAWGFDLYASRYWALRTMLETDYDGPNSIVDPDLHMVDASLPEKSTAALRGAGLSEKLLKTIYHDVVERVFASAP